MRGRIVFLAVLASSHLAAAQPDPQPLPDPYGEPQAAPAPLPPPRPIPSDPSAALREANAAATAGDWQRVTELVSPLLARQLGNADLAEAHRLAGLVAFFARRENEAEREFLAYLRIDLDGHLDPTLYPPEAVSFFDDVRARHAAELRALRPKSKHSSLLVALVPPFAQFQNGEPGKGWVIGGLLGAFAIANVSTYLVLRSWCRDPGSTCDNTGTNHYRAANSLHGINITAGIGLIVTYVWGVYDGVSGYRRRAHEQVVAPYASPTNDGAVIGVTGRF